jgi:uncharacterized protein (TIGR03000 family)
MNSALLVVRLPADAKLMIDDYVAQSTSPVRTFITPPLEPGKEFSYELKAEAIRDGHQVSATKRVVVRAGQETRAILDFQEGAVSRR